MDNSREKKGKCKKCNASTIKWFVYCSFCDKKYNNELIVTSNLSYQTSDENINFLILKLIEKFQKFDEVILYFKEEDRIIAKMITEKTRRLGYACLKRKPTNRKDTIPPYDEVDYFKQSLKLLPVVKAFNKDKRWDD